MTKFDEEYKRLNDAQRAAVDKIDGPVLVMAGPGTGKTQLLGMRVANILKTADVLPQNVLCLTFTDNAARNMLERLESIAGQPTYHVAIHTFHSFGDQIINQYPDFFTDRLMVQAIDQLGSYEILRGIFEDLPHSSPLSAKIGEDYVFLKDSLSVIGWLKSNAVQPVEFVKVLKSNQSFFSVANKLVSETFKQTPSAKLLPIYQKLLEELRKLGGEHPGKAFWSYADTTASELKQAIGDTGEGRYAPAITSWRKSWLEKNAAGDYVFKDSDRAEAKILALSGVYSDFQAALAKRGLYDFNDMIMEVVRSIETYNELKLNLQERFQYILVDEFQDTNGAQLRILAALADNPLFENKPNLMVVGDPNQAIFAFQGALATAMTNFMGQYNEVAIIVLNENYRSSQVILDASLEIAKQLPGISADGLRLNAGLTYPTTIIEHDVMSSELAQYQWVAEKIRGYLTQGIQPEQIAVIAPRHRYLERLMPYLATAKIPVAYERRENILDAPIISQLLKMAELVVAISKADFLASDALLAEVLAYDFWGLTAEELMSISLKAYDDHQHWLPLLIKDKGKAGQVASWFVKLARNAASEPLEYILDALGGTPASGIDDADQDEAAETVRVDKFVSPFISYYFGGGNFESKTDQYLSHLGQLATLRQHLRSWKPDADLHIVDLVEFVELHRQAGIKIVDNNPHTQTVKAVQVMTAYKAKGLEFEVVFAINAQDEVWGPKARSYAERLRLPRNLPLKPAGDSDADKLRLFFVALTRAKHSLHITSYTRTLDNKLSLGLSFVGGNSKEATPPHVSFKPNFIESVAGTQAAQILATDWAYRYRQIIADKPVLFEPILKDYFLSATHFNNFLDVSQGGPGYFLLHNLLRFPASMPPPAAYGDAIHKTLQWLQTEFSTQGELPPDKIWQDYFNDILERKHLRAADYNRYQKRGVAALIDYLHQRGANFKASDIVEHSFIREGVVVDGVRLTGKIDKITGTATSTPKVIDFKTGKPSSSWNGKDDYERAKLHRYSQQLMFYKLLVENSASYGKRFTVREGALEFVETDGAKKVIELPLQFDDKEVEKLKVLIQRVWEHIMKLDFPDVSGYNSDYKGVLAFEQDLLDGNI